MQIFCFFGFIGRELYTDSVRKKARKGRSGGNNGNRVRIRQLSCGNCLLGQTHPVFADHLLAAAHNRCIGTIIDIQMNDMGSRIIVRKINDQTNIRSAKPVNGLVIIADDKKIGRISRKELNAFKLLPVDVLKFINEKIPISLLP